MIRSSFPRRQQYRRLRRAAASGAAAWRPAPRGRAASVGAPERARARSCSSRRRLVIDARRWLRLAGRSRVGARSEDGGPAGARRARSRGVAAAPFAAAIEDTATSTASRSPRPGSPSRSNRRPEPSTPTTSPTPARWRHGFAATAGAGAAPARWRSCASSARGAWSGRGRRADRVA